VENGLSRVGDLPHLFLRTFAFVVLVSSSDNPMLRDVQGIHDRVIQLGLGEHKLTSILNKFSKPHGSLLGFRSTY
jgi:hypothetical protein